MDACAFSLLYVVVFVKSGRQTVGVNGIINRMAVYVFISF